MELIRNKRINSGFSLVELLIASIIVLTVIAIVLQVFVFVNKNHKILTGYLNSFLKGREIIDRIAKDCRMAVRVMDDYSGYSTGDSCLILKTPSVNMSGDILDVNDEFDYIIYRIDDSGNLWKTVFPGSSSSRPACDGIIKRSIKNLYFTHDGNFLSTLAHKSVITYLTLQVMIEETIMGEQYAVNPGTTVKLMNYEWEFIR